MSGWPAVEDAAIWPSGRPEPMDLERAIYGKVHAARSDFRWIAASSREHLEGLAQRVGPGLVHESGRASAWRVDGAMRHAVSLQPSSARDAAGRAGLVDTQVLTWRHPHPVPLATPLHAAWLLQQAASLDTKAAWWEERKHPGWTRRDFMLGGEHVPTPAGPPAASRLHDTLADGLEDLQALLGEEAHRGSFVRFYAALFARTQDLDLERSSPAVLFGMPRPLPPAALAALLLPLPSFLAGRLSLLGWELASRNRPEALAENWDVVVTGAHSGLVGLAEEPLPDELIELARVVVRGLAEGSPEELPALDVDLELDELTGRRRTGAPASTAAPDPAPQPAPTEPAAPGESELLSPEDADFLRELLTDSAGRPLLEGLAPEDFMEAVSGLESFEPLGHQLQNPRVRRLLTAMPGWEAAAGRIFARERGGQALKLPQAAASALRKAGLDASQGLPLSWLEALLDERANLENLTLDAALLDAMKARHRDLVDWATLFLQVPCQPEHIRTLLQDRLPHALVELLAYSVDPRAATLDPKRLLEPGARDLELVAEPEDAAVATGLVAAAWKAELVGRPNREPLPEVRDSLRAAAVALLPGEEILDAVSMARTRRLRRHPLHLVPWLGSEGRRAWASRWTEAQLRTLLDSPGPTPVNPRTGAPWPSDHERRALLLAANQAERGLDGAEEEEPGGPEPVAEDPESDRPTAVDPLPPPGPGATAQDYISALLELEASGLDRADLVREAEALLRGTPPTAEVRHRLSRLALILELLRRGQVG